MAKTEKNRFKARLELKDFKESYETPNQTVMVRGPYKLLLNDDGFTYLFAGNNGTNSSTKIDYNQAEAFLESI